MKHSHTLAAQQTPNRDTYQTGSPVAYHPLGGVNRMA